MSKPYDAERKIMYPFLLVLISGVTALFCAIGFYPEQHEAGGYQLLMTYAGMCAGASIAFLYQYANRP